MKTVKTPMTPAQKRLKQANSVVHKPIGGLGVKPIKPAKPAFAKKPK